MYSTSAMSDALICPTSQGKTEHIRHAQIARRANLSQAFWIAEMAKSAAHCARPAPTRATVLK
jgi:hypothetical protein